MTFGPGQPGWRFYRWQERWDAGFHEPHLGADLRPADFDGDVRWREQHEREHRRACRAESLAVDRT